MVVDIVAANNAPAVVAIFPNFVLVLIDVFLSIVVLAIVFMIRLVVFCILFSSSFFC